MMWTFFTLNTYSFRLIPYPLIMRWVLLAILVASAVLFNKGEFVIPPAIIFLYLLAVIPSCFASVDITESSVKILSFITVVWGCYIFFYSFDCEEDFYSLFKILTIVIIAFEIASVVFILTGKGFTGERARGVTTNANTLGVYSNMAFFASFYWFNKCKKFKKFIFFILMLCSAGTVLASGSRTAFIVLCMSAAVIVFLNLKSTPARLFAILFIVFAAYLLLSGKLEFLNIQALNRLNEEGGTDRGDLWDKGIEVWQRFPIFGCGYANSQIYNDTPGEEHYPFHNSYLTILAEVGVWGSVIIGLMIIIELVCIFKMILERKESQDMPLLLIGALMLVSLLISAYSESFLLAVGSTEACTFWVIFTWFIAYRDKIFRENYIIK